MNIVFDFGGVLLRWRPAEFMARLLPDHAGDAAATATLVERFFEGFGGDWAEFDRGTLAVVPLVQRIAARTGVSAAEVRRVVDAVPLELEPIDGTAALLPRLRARGHRLFFLSNMPAPYADHLDRTHPFIGQFDGGVYSSRVQLIKPEPAIFEHAVRAFRLDAAQTLFIDDVEHNAAAARAAGWQAFRFVDPAQCAQELERRGVLPAGA